MSGSNVYGILRAGRSSSAESLVFSAPYPSPGTASNLHGLAVMLSLAEYFHSEPCHMAADSSLLYGSQSHKLRIFTLKSKDDFSKIQCIFNFFQQVRITGRRISFSYSQQVMKLGPKHGSIVTWETTLQVSKIFQQVSGTKNMPLV